MAIYPEFTVLVNYFIGILAELYIDIKTGEHPLKFIVNFFQYFLDAKGLTSSSEVELLREKVYASLEAYCKQKYPDQQGR